MSLFKNLATRCSPTPKLNEGFLVFNVETAPKTNCDPYFS